MNRGVVIQRIRVEPRLPTGTATGGLGIAGIRCSRLELTRQAPFHGLGGILVELHILPGDITQFVYFKCFASTAQGQQKNH